VIAVSCYEVQRDLVAASCASQMVSALYSKDSEEKRLLDGMLLAVPR